MAELSPQMPPKDERIPFWRDGRVIGILAQIIFVIFLVLGTTWILNNVNDNISSLGSFRCPDGSGQFHMRLQLPQHRRAVRDCGVDDRLRSEHALFAGAAGGGTEHA